MGNYVSDSLGNYLNERSPTLGNYVSADSRGKTKCLLVEWLGFAAAEQVDGRAVVGAEGATEWCVVEVGQNGQAWCARSLPGVEGALDKPADPKRRRNADAQDDCGDHADDHPPEYAMSMTP
jgi:hypothetical protein